MTRPRPVGLVVGLLLASLPAALVPAALVPAMDASAAASTTSRTGAAAITNLAPPRVLGTPEYGERLAVAPGRWDPGDVEVVSVQWLRDGSPRGEVVAVEGPDGLGDAATRYRPVLSDIGHDLSVRVTVARPEDPATTASADAAAVRVRRGTLESVRRPDVDGVLRFGRTLVADTGTWDRTPQRLRVRWLREGEPIPGATGRRHPVAVADVGRRLAVRVTARREGFRPLTVDSARTGRVQHRVPVRRTVTYRVETRGAISTSRATFRRQAQQTFDDPRGWRGAGIAFRRVARGGAFSLVLAEAARVPDFSSGCSAEWSCRVGRYVIINQMRWRDASPMWRQTGRSLRDYRHMVVDHEAGHWLGWGHRSCPRRGAPAPVMQQQSMGLQGCRPNPWPSAAERNVPRF